MQQLLQYILDRLMTLWPLYVVREWNTAVLVRGGKIKRELLPGIGWRWPFLDEVLSSPRTECVVDLSTAAIETRDGIAVALSANMAYRITSLAKLWRTVYDMDDSLSRLAIGRIASHVACLRAASLKTKRDQLEANLVADLAVAAAAWGIEVTRVHVTDCVRIKAHRHYVEGIYPGDVE
jgi:regulator of protease activity HflC (stomatin/prohibitin superfamily)